MPPDPVECGAPMISFGVTNRTSNFILPNYAPSIFGEFLRGNCAVTKLPQTTGLDAVNLASSAVCSESCRKCDAAESGKKVEMNFKFGATFAWRHVKSMKVPPVGLVAPATSKDSTEPVAVD